MGVLLGNGDGTFQAPVFYNDGGYASYLAVADYNGDGHADMAVVSNSTAVSVLLGNADGTFDAPKIYVVSTLPLSSITAGDFNGDGKADLVLATGFGTGSAVIVLLGNGDGTFQPALTYSIDSPASIGLGDFNGDGKTDLVITSWNTFSVSVALGNGDGTFQPAVPCTFPQGIYAGSIPAAGDFNGDGKLDFAVTNPYPPTVAVLLGNGDGTFQPAVTYASTPQPGLVEIGDFNGDGRPDLVTSDYPVFPQTTGSMNVLLGNGDGTFQPQVAYSFPVALGSAVVGDINGDGTTDLAATFQDGTLRVLIGIAAKSTTPTLAASPNPSIFEQNVTLTAAVSPTAATGTVTFYDGSTELGNASLSGGAAELPVLSFTTGAHSLKAVYGGDTDDLTSTSAVLTQTVDPLPTSATLTSTPNPSTFGQPVTLKATVKPATATGTVAFYHGSTSLGTSTLTSGKATLAVSTLTVGTHALTATYSGGENDAVSTSPSLTQTVGKAPTTTTLASSPNPSTFRQNVTLTATVSPATATGTITFYNGTSTLGTGTLTAGTATLTLSTLPLGSSSLTASYGGDANDTLSTSATLMQVVRDPTATILTASPNPSAVGQAVTPTATVTPSAATGKVTFYHGSTAMGSGAPTKGTAAIPRPRPAVR